MAKCIIEFSDDPNTTGKVNVEVVFVPPVDDQTDSPAQGTAAEFLEMMKRKLEKV